MSAELEPGSERGALSAAQRERIAACFLASMPTDEEIDRARRRFNRSRSVPRRQTKALLLALAYGIVLGLASAAAAAFVADHVVGVEPAAPADTEPKTLRAVAPAEAGWGGKLRIDTPQPAAPAEPPPTAAFAAVPPEHAAARAALEPGGVRATPEPGRESQLQPVPVPPSPKTPDQESAPSGNESTASLPPVASAVAGPWERAAKALAAGNWDGADKAFNELDQSRDAHARDAAALARAQLWIANGRGAEVKPILQRLASQGRTPLIRRRAAALLQTL
jgi:hypothetical protein